ncbi:hypothetical protein GOODEAATRI_001258 [Goodea atripinnis]|uniref:Uncharacterized protein n=1 Tax=Goodea atripinnis TaxID=208336 RepID=A0ABV0ME40_9TELE
MHARGEHANSLQKDPQLGVEHTIFLLQQCYQLHYCAARKKIYFKFFTLFPAYTSLNLTWFSAVQTHPFHTFITLFPQAELLLLITSFATCICSKQYLPQRRAAEVEAVVYLTL